MAEDGASNEQDQDAVMRLIEQGRLRPGVQEALAVFYSALERAPYVPPRTPTVSFSASANS